MKAIYEVKFLDKREPTTVMDTRKVAGDASTKGFKKALAWAEGVCADDEMVGGIQMIACERL